MTNPKIGPRRMARILAPAVLAAGLVSGAMAQPTEWVIDRFSMPADQEGLPPGWEALTFQKIPKHTVYTIMQ
ncbi:MAG TPA: hypothetical protein VI702_06765, partial [Nitrospiria bacterium]